MKIVLGMFAIPSNVFAGGSVAGSFSWYQCYILEAFFLCGRGATANT